MQQWLQPLQCTTRPYLFCLTYSITLSFDAAYKREQRRLVSDSHCQPSCMSPNTGREESQTDCANYRRAINTDLARMSQDHSDADSYLSTVAQQYKKPDSTCFIEALATISKPRLLDSLCVKIFGPIRSCLGFMLFTIEYFALGCHTVVTNP